MIYPLIILFCFAINFVVIFKAFFLRNVCYQILCNINTLKSHQNKKQNDANMDQFFITPIFMHLVKTHSFLL